jgi:hypothetical protein
MRLCLGVLCLLASWTVAHAEPIHLIYFRMPPFADEAGGKASGPAVALVEELTEGLGVAGPPIQMPLKRLEHALQTEKTIAIGLGRNARRETLGFTWVIELFHDDYYFVTLAAHTPVTGFDDARKLTRIACNLGSAPADILLGQGFTNLENANDLRSEAAKLRAGHTDGWFDLKIFIEQTWRSLGYDPAELQWSRPVQSQSIWIAASHLIEPAVIETMRERYESLKSEGRLDPLLAKLVQ